MNLIEMDGFLRGKCLPGDMKVNETNAEYLVRKFAALEQQLAESQSKLAQMAAENAGLKYTASCLLSEYLMNKGTDSEFVACITPAKDTIGTGGVWDMWRHLELILKETPTTSSFLAEVRAQGVDVARNALIKFVDDETGPNENVPGFIRGAEICESIAAQIRQGGAA